MPTGSGAGFEWRGPHDRARRTAEFLLAGVATICAAYALTFAAAVLLAARIVQLGSGHAVRWNLRLGPVRGAVVTLALLGVLATLIAVIVSESLAARAARLARARPPESDEAVRAQTCVDDLALALGFHTPTVRLVDNAAPNAFAAGRSRACVVGLTTGALQLPPDQLKSLCAQTMASVANRALPLTCAAADLIVLARRFTRSVWYLSGVLLVSTIFGVDPLLVAAVTAAIMLLVVVTIPLIAVAERAIPRLRTRAVLLADLDAVAITNQPAALARLLLTSANDGNSVTSSWAVAALWFDHDTVRRAPGRFVQRLQPFVDSDVGTSTPEPARRAHAELIERARVIVELTSGDPTLRAELLRAEQA